MGGEGEGGGGKGRRVGMRSTYSVLTDKALKRSLIEKRKVTEFLVPMTVLPTWSRAVHPHLDSSAPGSGVADVPGVVGVWEVSDTLRGPEKARVSGGSDPIG